MDPRADAVYVLKRENENNQGGISMQSMILLFILLFVFLCMVLLAVLFCRLGSMERSMQMLASRGVGALPYTFPLPPPARSEVFPPY